MRLTHDLRRLHEIKGVDLKIAAKREMLPEYADWVKGLLDVDAGVGTGVSAEVLPTVMVWLIDVGAFDGALELVPFVLRHNVQMPARYNRDAATIVVEEIAEAALKAHNAGAHFDLGVLLRVAELTDAIDMHDQARAKLRKATGAQQLFIAEDMEANAESRAMLEAALASLKAAQALNDRIGVKDKIKRAEKMLAAQDAAAAATTKQPNHEDGSAA
ncbi:phage terminase small subunit [Sphingobium sp. B2D3C]|uniref:phage terminase small subunit n=1 Tax=Sphingobium sp. B2D3C TaxID=2940581 RepID=UPI002225220D|nr:phage terminase small subunit [Sphingobium sp. B2D3C]